MGREATERRWVAKNVFWVMYGRAQMFSVCKLDFAVSLSSFRRWGEVVLLLIPYDLKRGKTHDGRLVPGLIDDQHIPPGLVEDEWIADGVVFYSRTRQLARLGPGHCSSPAEKTRRHCRLCLHRLHP